LAQQQSGFVSSIGHAFSAADFIDAHFEMARPEYEVQLRAVGIQPGWHVLDAACGSGSFLPWMAELVGPDGRLAALDLDPDNLALVKRRLAGWQLLCPIETHAGTILNPPYPDDTFDAVWFANTSQYLTDIELDTTVAEFQRVVRPGGLMALKESDCTLYRVYPAAPGLMLRFFQADARAGNVQMAGGLRAPALSSRLRQAGLVNVWQGSTLIERATPLDSAAHMFWSGALTYWSEHAAVLDLPASDQEFWEQLRDPEALAAFLVDRDCCLIEGNTLAVGTVPMVVEASS
jgi:SAM-dependent methyltransferase